jgi:hypothetical protein
MPCSFSRAVVALLLTAGCAASALAQASRSTAGELDTPRVQIYTGYSYWYPLSAHIANISYPEEKFGAIGSATYFLKPWVGVTAQFSSHVNDDRGPEGTMDAGLQFQTNIRRFTPFVHVLGGSTYLGGPAFNGRKYGWNATAGIGLDWLPSYHHDWLGVRLFQGDYEYNHVDFGPLAPNHLTGGVANARFVNASAGLVFRFGGHHVQEMEPQMSCSANRVDTMPGEPVTVTSQLLGFDVMKPIQYTWHTSGGIITGEGGDIAHIDTTGLPPGDYKVTGTVVQGRRRSAQCNAAFSIRQPLPPTITCVASPATVAPGGTATITTSGVSPDNRPLTYAFNATSGRLNVTGNTATITAPLTRDPGATTTMTVTCTVRNDRGQMASAAVTIPVTLKESYATDPNLAPLPLQNDMCSVSFNRDPRRPARVDNEGKACLDGIALSLQRDENSALVVLGDHTRREGAAIAAERALNVKLYLTQEKGIDPARIQVRAKDAGAAQVQNVFLPAGSTFNDEGRVVNESAVIHHSESYGRPGATHPRTTRRRTTRRRTRSTGASTTPMTGQSTPPSSGQVPQPQR